MLKVRNKTVRLAVSLVIGGYFVFGGFTSVTITVPGYAYIIGGVAIIYLGIRDYYANRKK